ncbi:DUF222 domain-containing protein, partial [Mycolicibacterium flavescens]|uniref:DUF222 domain-containing protein n=1 Tax=Mycolicibacterium flavescens TaxID=1776 RepID=UPI0013F4D848
MVRRELDVLRSEPLDGASTAELLALTADFESVLRSSAVVGHRVVAQLGRAPVGELGESSVSRALQTLLNISKGEANRRVGEAHDLAPRLAMTGEVLAPVMPNVAAGVAAGRIGSEQVAILRKFFNKQIPASVGFDVREAAEAHLAQEAARLGPAGLEKTVEHMVSVLQEHFEFREHERRRKTGVWFGPQDRDGISKIHGAVDAPTRGWIEAVWASYGAPGKNMPDAESEPEPQPEPQPEPEPDFGPEPDVGPGPEFDYDAELDPWNDFDPGFDDAEPEPEADPDPGFELDFDAGPEAAPEPEPVAAEVEPAVPEVLIRDTRTRAQRNHDALAAMCRDLLAARSGRTHNGFPVTMVITATLQDLEKAAGFGVTAGGTVVAIPDVIAMAAKTQHYLAIFDKHTNEPLYLGRAKRCASTAQRLMLFAAERGCTRPGCSAPAYETQVHHAVADWADDGHTN